MELRTRGGVAGLGALAATAAVWLAALVLAPAPAAAQDLGYADPVATAAQEAGGDEPAAPPAAEEPGDADDDAGSGEDDLEAYWDQRLARARQRIEIARERMAKADAEYSRARHDQYPRGEALAEIEERHRAAERELRAAEAALPRLVEQARRAGVSPGVLREYWDEDDAQDEPS